MKKTASKEEGGRLPVKKRKVDSQEERAEKADTPKKGESEEDTQEIEREEASQEGEREEDTQEK